MKFTRVSMMYGSMNSVRRGGPSPHCGGPVYKCSENTPVWGSTALNSDLQDVSISNCNYINRPPVHSMQVPVTYEDNGLARNSITRAASSAVPGRPSGISETSRHFFAFSGIPSLMDCPPSDIASDSLGGRVIRVSIHPYATALARTLYLKQKSVSTCRPYIE